MNKNSILRLDDFYDVGSEMEEKWKEFLSENDQILSLKEDWNANGPITFPLLVPGTQPPQQISLVRTCEPTSELGGAQFVHLPEEMEQNSNRIRLKWFKCCHCSARRTYECSMELHMQLQHPDLLKSVSKSRKKNKAEALTEVALMSNSSQLLLLPEDAFENSQVLFPADWKVNEPNKNINQNSVEVDHCKTKDKTQLKLPKTGKARKNQPVEMFVPSQHQILVKPIEAASGVSPANAFIPLPNIFVPKVLSMKEVELGNREIDHCYYRPDTGTNQQPEYSQIKQKTEFQAQPKKETFKCDKCGYKSAKEANLKDHMSLGHLKKSQWFHCRSCEYKANARSLMKEHLVKRHSNKQ